jgi:hypothetical protein
MRGIVMTTPAWQKLDLLKVDARPVGLWNLAIEYVSGSRLLRFKVVALDDLGHIFPSVWSPIKATECGADGIVTTPLKTGLLCSGAQYGSLIGKLGGSSADLSNANSAGASGNSKVFAVGSYCVMSVGSSEGGPLFLTMNDSPDGFEGHKGELLVSIEHYSTWYSGY